MRVPGKQAVFLGLLLAAAFFRFPPLQDSALQPDEAVYAQIIREFGPRPLELIPHYLGNPAAWKPPAGFYLYAPVTAAINYALPGLPIEVAYRAAPALFAALSVFVLYLLLKQFYPEKQALYASMVFALANQTLSTTNYLLLDSALLFFTLCALYSYAKSLKRRSAPWLLSAVLFSALAALTKTYAALAIPCVAFAMYFYYEKKRLKEAGILASFLAVPAAMALYAAAFSLLVPGGFREVASSYLYDFVGRIASKTLPETLASNSAELFKRMFPWGILSIAGAAAISLKKPEHKLASMWAAVSLITLANQQEYFWYHLMAVPPLALLASFPLFKLGIRRASAVFLAFAILSLYAYPLFSGESAEAEAQKEMGLMLKGHGKILSLTRAGVPTALFYAFQGTDSPDYASLLQMVAEPYAGGSYSAFPRVSDVVFGRIEQNRLAAPEDGYIQGLILNNSPDAVLMGKKIFDEYARNPLPGYNAAYASSNGDYVALLKEQE